MTASPEIVYVASMLGDSSFRLPVFQGTPETKGTGYFTREGAEHVVKGHFDASAPKAKQGKPYALLIRPCWRCGGAGGADKWAHTGWRCFDCGGSGQAPEKPIRLYQQAELDILNDRRDTARAKKAEIRVKAAETEEARLERARQARADVLETLPLFRDLRDLIHSFTEDKPAPDFLRQMWNTIQVKDLTEGQSTAVKKFIDTARDKAFKRRNSDYLGVVGEKMEIVVKVATIKQFYTKQVWPGGSDISYIVKLETRDRNMLTWFTRNPPKKDEILKGTAKIVGHKAFDGVRETQITNFRRKGHVDLKQGELF